MLYLVYVLQFVTTTDEKQKYTHKQLCNESCMFNAHVCLTFLMDTCSGSPQEAPRTGSGPRVAY